MTQARPAIVVFAVVMAVAVPLATPATAATVAAPNLLVASQHTTDTEFNAADTLTNVSVVGSGTAASVELFAGSSGTVTRDADNSQTGSQSTARGLIINPNKNLDSITVTTSSQTTDVSTAYLFDDNGNKLDQAPITSGTATLTASLSAGQQYHVGADKGTQTSTVGLDNSPNGPYSDSFLDIDAGSVDNTTTANGNLYAFKSVEGSIAAGDGAYVSANHSATDPPEAFANLTLSDANATVEWQRWTGSSWAVDNSSTFSSGGNKTLALSDTADKWRVNVSFNLTGSNPTAELHDEGLLFDAAGPTVDNGSASPQGGTQLSQRTANLSVAVTDADLATAQGDNVTVDFAVSGPTQQGYSTVGSETLSSNGTANISYTPSVGGGFHWRATATDDYGNTVTSQTFSFETPSTISIRNETNTSELLNQTTVTVRSFGADDVIVNSTTTAAVNMSGLPVTAPLTIQAEASGFYDRRATIKSLYEQQTIYLLNDSNPTAQTRFTLDDKTGAFDETNSRVFVQRPLSLNGTTKYRTMASDTFGVSGFTVELDKNVRYQIVVESADGDRRRVLGTHTADVDESVNLEIGSLSFGLENDAQAIDVGARTRNKTGQRPEVLANYNDTARETTELQIVVREHKNASNEIYNNTITNGASPVGETSITATAPNGTETWVVDVSATRDGEDFSATYIADRGPGSPGIPIDQQWRNVVGSGLILLIAGGTGALRPALASVTTGITGGLLWYVGWIHPAIGGGAVILSIAAPAMIYISESGGVR